MGNFISLIKVISFIKVFRLRKIIFKDSNRCHLHETLGLVEFTRRYLKIHNVRVSRAGTWSLEKIALCMSAHVSKELRTSSPSTCRTKPYSAFIFRLGFQKSYAIQSERTRLSFEFGRL